MDSDKPKVLKEILELRGTNSKTYLLDNGQNQLQGFKNPIHYEKNGKLYDIDTNIQDGRVEHTPYIGTMLTDKIGLSIIKKADNKRIDVKLHKIGDKEIKYSLPLIEGNTATWEDVTKDVDIILEFGSTTARMWRKLKSPEAEKTAEWEIIEDGKLNKMGLNLNFFGKDAEGRALHLKTEKLEEKEEKTKDDKDIKRYLMRDTFTGKTITRDEESRVKSLSDEVTYPVVIDPEVRVWF